MDKTQKQYEAMRADILMKQAIMADEYIIQEKKKEFNKPIAEHPFIKTVKGWCKANKMKFDL